jgi:hypothetical protein
VSIAWRGDLAAATDWWHQVDLCVVAEQLREIAVIEDRAIDRDSDVRAQLVLLDDAPDEFGALCLGGTEDGAERGALHLESITAARERPQRRGDMEYRHGAASLVSLPLGGL